MKASKNRTGTPCCLLCCFVMNDNEMDSELRTALTRRIHWRAQFEAALAADDREGAANALKHLRLYDWVIEGMAT